MTEAVLTAGDLGMDLIARTVTRAGKTINLLPREFTLLEHLLRRKGRVQTRTMLLEAIWDLSFDPQTNVVESHVSRLRAKVDTPFERELIHTVSGAGYTIEAKGVIARLLRALKRSAGSTPTRQAIGLLAVVAVVNLVTLGVAHLSLRNAAEEACALIWLRTWRGFRLPLRRGA